ncbi:MAG: methyltransferase family protein [Candidatus Thorarchaeota archaeon]
MNNQVENDIPLLGVGPKIFIVFAPFMILFGILNSFIYPIFRITKNYYWIFIIGLIMSILGTLMFIYSERNIKSAYRTSELITTKIYAYVRHPMYAIWGLAILPGILCLFNSWFLFLVLPIYYIIVRLFIKKEEKYLEKKFGEEYVNYKTQVNAFFPKLKKYKPN